MGTFNILSINFLLSKKMQAAGTPPPMPRPTTPPGAPFRKRNNTYAEVVMGNFPPCIDEDEDEDEFPTLEEASLPVIPFGDDVGLVKDNGDGDDGDEDDEDDDDYVDPDVEVELLETSIDKEVQNLDRKVQRTKPKEKPKKKRKEIPETLAWIKEQKRIKAYQNGKEKKKKKEEEGKARDDKRIRNSVGNVGPYI